jgi:NifU-like protein involved in Fe-S cluster formation
MYRDENMRSVAAEIVRGKSIDEILSLSSGQVMSRLDGLHREHRHCSILAVSILYKARTDYLLKY